MEIDGGIGTLHEMSLHAAIKRLYEGPETKFEVPVDGYVIDVVRDGILIEIQTRNFSTIKDKIFKLMKSHRLHLVYPIAADKWVVRQTPDGTREIGRRHSPKRLGYADVFEELVSIPTFFHNDNFSMELILIREEEIRRQDGKGSWRRRGWSTVDRRLIDIIDRHIYRQPSDFLHFIPNDLNQHFTVRELAKASEIPIRTAQKMVYCLRKMNVLHIVGKEGNAHLLAVR